MKAIFYWIVVLSFFGSGTWLLLNKDVSAPYEVPYLSEASFGDISGGSLITSKVASVEEWKGILTGKWNYNFIERTDKLYHTMVGEVDFKEDGTFFKYITWKRFRSGYDFGKAKASTITGGSYSGTWEISNEILQEKILKCNIPKKDNIDVCKAFYKRGVIKSYGQFNDDGTKSEVLQFNENKILINSKSFATGETSTYIFTRAKK